MPNSLKVSNKVVHDRQVRRAAVCSVLFALISLAVAASTEAMPTTASVQAKLVPIPVNPDASKSPAYPGTGNILGAGAAFEGELEIQGDEYGGFPPPLTGFSIYVPHGVKLHQQGFPICPQAILESHEVANCPKGSQLTSVGSVSGVVSFGGDRVHETLTVQGFFAAGGRIAYYAEGTSPALVEVLGSGAFIPANGGFASKFSASVPLVATVPEAPYAVVQSVRVRVGAAYRRGSRLVPFMTLPRHCAKGGMADRLELTFLTGPPVQVNITMPCPARH
ncbi:MAG TPA: hypothetical protein VFR48_11695 [Solirubrobacteraceae bacterium]|nr:hypothetical protein [Solirubrobacteraceae bacterium]